MLRIILYILSGLLLIRLLSFLVRGLIGAPRRNTVGRRSGEEVGKGEIVIDEIENQEE